MEVISWAKSFLFLASQMWILAGFTSFLCDNTVKMIRQKNPILINKLGFGEIVMDIFTVFWHLKSKQLIHNENNH